jgi:hypothetical protein
MGRITPAFSGLVELAPNAFMGDYHDVWDAPTGALSTQ